MDEAPLTSKTPRNVVPWAMAIALLVVLVGLSVAAWYQMNKSFGTISNALKEVQSKLTTTAAPAEKVSEEKQTRVVQEYDFFCETPGRGPIQFTSVVDPVLERAGWTTIKDGSQLCYRTDRPEEKDMLVRTRGQCRVDEVFGRLCAEEAILLFRRNASDPIRKLASVETEGSYIDEVVAWTPTTVSYKVRPNYHEGPGPECSTNPEVYRIVAVSLADGTERVSKSCHTADCSGPFELLECEIRE